MVSRTVLVTGAHGFIGRHVCRAFNTHGYSVTGIGHGEWTVEEQRYYGVSKWHCADVTLDSLVAYGGVPDVLIHCAGSGSVAFSMEKPFDDHLRNVTCTAAVLEYIRTAAPNAALVYPSSAAVYGNARRLPIHESDPTRPSSPYGFHKLIAEQLCRSYAINYGLSIAIVRCFSIYGEGLRKQLLWDACRKLNRNEYEFFGSGGEIRDWLHVTDISSLLFLASKHASSACPIVNGGSGEGIPVREILKEVIRTYGSALALHFSGQSRAGDPPGFQANIGSALEWGWTPTITWRQGVHQYVRWFLAAQ